MKIMEKTSSSNIKIRQFELYVDIVEKFISNRNQNISCLMHPILHITRHYGPFVNLSKEINTYTLEVTLKLAGRFFYRSLHLIVGILRSLFLFGNNKKIQIIKTDALIISHIDRYDQVSSLSDFYYGVIHREINACGLSCMYLYTNKNCLDLDEKLRLLAKHDNISRHSIRNRTNFTQELIFFFNALAIGLQFFLKSFFEAQRCRRRLLRMMCSHYADIIPTLRMAQEVKKFCIASGAKIVIYTFEGHSWEKAVNAAVRTLVEKPLCIGYQHSSIFPYSSIGRLRFPDVMTPDYVLCTGHRFKRYLEVKLQYSQQPCIINVGRLSCFRDQVPLDIKSHRQYSAKAKKYDLLVLLSGERQEADNMLKFVEQLLSKTQKFKIVFRAHPVNTTYVHQRVKKLSESIGLHLIVSRETLIQDALSSRFSLYRDSLSAIETTAQGCIPIFLAEGPSLSADPFYLLTEFKREFVCSSEHLKHILEKSVADPILPSIDYFGVLWEKYKEDNCRAFFSTLIH